MIRVLLLAGVALVIAGDLPAEECPDLAKTLEAGAVCKRDNCADFSVPNAKGYTKEQVYYTYCWDNPDWGTIRADDPLPYLIDKMQRTRYPTPIVFQTPCDCLDKLAKVFPDCKVDVCKPPKAAPAPAAPAPPPIAEPEETPAPAPSTEVAASSPPVDATVVKNNGGCSLLRDP
jgi:hypothetical protein